MENFDEENCSPLVPRDRITSHEYTGFGLQEMSIEPSFDEDVSQLHI